LSDVKIFNLKKLEDEQIEAERIFAAEQGIMSDEEFKEWLRCAILPRELAHNSDPSAEWGCQTDTGIWFYFPDEGGAVEFQKKWRAAHMLDPETGLLSVQNYDAYGVVRLGSLASSSPLANVELVASKKWMGAELSGEVLYVLVVEEGAELSDVLQRAE
jgi:hypothetical protein